MPKRPLIVTRGSRRPPASRSDVESMTWQALQTLFRRSPMQCICHRYPSIELRLADIDRLHRPLATNLLLMLIAKQPRTLLGDDGRQQRIGFRRLLRDFINETQDRLATRKLIRTAHCELDAIEQRLISRQPQPLRTDRDAIYLRTDLVFGLTSGGSIGHVAGVANELAKQLSHLHLFTTDTMPGADSSIAQTMLNPGRRHWGQAERIALSANASYRRALGNAMKIIDGGIIYQRYSLNNFSGLHLACESNLPLVIEFNGSEPWIARQWSDKPLRYEAIAQRIESLNLKHADLVVVVSEPMRKMAIDLGALTDRVLVNPNGVDPNTYHPAVGHADVTNRYVLENKTVIGFIGTFDRWHGAPVLIDAVTKLLIRRPDLRHTISILMIGDGPQHAACKKQTEQVGLGNIIQFTGRIPQEEGPAHLAACDILASPHVPNADGSAFFGSPTKLFEYMAMGRAIAASSLGQIAEVLSHDINALLAEPGDAENFSHLLERLIDDKTLRRRLGQAAREQALSHHTWQAHVERIINRLTARTD